MKRLILTIFFLTKISLCYGENPCTIMSPQKSGEWGIGFCWFPENTRVSLYNKPKGEKIGTLTRNKNGTLVFERLKPDSDIQLNYNDFVWVGHVSVTLLKVYETKSTGFYNVLNQSKKSGGWLDQKEVDRLKIRFLTYGTLLLDTKKGVPAELNQLIKTANIGVNVSESSLNLRTENDITSEKVKMLTSNNPEQTNTHTHLKVLQSKENWIKVEATVYTYDAEKDDSGEGCGFKTSQKYIGWIKAIDENGFPNIWYSVTAY